MAGIFGFLKFSDTNNDPSVAKRLLAAARQGFEMPGNMLQTGNNHAAIGYALPQNVLSGKWPLASAEGRYWFQLFGNIYLPGGDLLHASNFDKDFLGPFLNSPESFLRRLEGEYVFALYDHQQQRFTLVNDPFGNFVLRYFHDPSGFFFSSQLHILKELSGQNEWDSAGFGEYLAVGFPFKGKTIYRNIRRLPPATLLQVDRNNCFTERYYRANYDAVSDSKATLEKIRRAFSESIDNRLKHHDNITVALTGGFDTRVTWSILSALNKSHSVNAFTHGMPDSRDLDIARKIAGRFNLHHQIQEFDEAFARALPPYWQQLIRLSEGAMPVTSAHSLTAWELLQDRNLLVDSHGGALFRRAFMKVAVRRIPPGGSLAGAILAAIKNPLLKAAALHQEVRRQSLENARLAIEDWLDELPPQMPVGDRVDLFYLQQISGAKYASLGNVQMNYVRLSHPFLTLPIYELVQKVPIALRANNSIYKYIIRKSDRAFEKFIIENSGLPAPYYGFGRLRYVPMVYERLLQTAALRLSVPVLKKYSIRKFMTDYEAFLKISGKILRENLLSPNPKFSEIVDRGKLEKQLSGFQDGRSVPAAEIVALLSLKIFLDEFHHP